MISYLVSHLWQIWLVVAILCLIIELSSGDFFVMCFSIAALVALVAAAIGLSPTVQVITFAVASVLCLVFVRPAALRWLHRHDSDRPSNADALIGREGRVSQAIEAGGYGRVAIDGDDWKARTATGEALAVGTKVRVLALDSIILTVEPINP